MVTGTATERKWIAKRTEAQGLGSFLETPEPSGARSASKGSVILGGASGSIVIQRVVIAA